MPKHPGRPMKYASFLEALEDERIYTPATIVRNGEEKGLFGHILDAEVLSRAKLRVRHALARLSANHQFPAPGDGWITMRGQPPLRGWTGHRWKSVLRKKRAALNPAAPERDEHVPG